MNSRSFRRSRPPFFRSAGTILVIVVLASHTGVAAQIAAASPPMTDPGGPAGSSNVANVYRLFADVFTGNNPAACPELIANGAVINTPDGTYRGHEGMSTFADGLRTSFPDASFVLTDLITSGDMVTARWTMTGTHDGAFEGIAATSAPVTVEGIAILRFEHGFVVEQWVSYDRLHLLRQIAAAADIQDGPSRACPPCQTPD